MDTHPEASREQALASASGFSRVVCGIDGSREGFEAARQAARLTAADGRLVLVAVAQFDAALAGRWGPEPARWRGSSASERSVDKCFADLRARARASLALAKRQADEPAEVVTRVVDGEVAVRLREVVDAESATLLVLGTHGGSRLAGAAFGEATTTLLHETPVSVLIARSPFDPDRFPASIVAGIDGSAEARRALDVAAALRERSGGRLMVVIASGEEGSSAGAKLEGFAAPHEFLASKARPVDALVTAAQTADLVVVGSRGLRGARALGSVSERVAHRASSSVLVVRPTAPEVAEGEG